MFVARERLQDILCQCHLLINLSTFFSRLTESNKNLQNQVSSLEVKDKLNDSSAVPLQYEVERVKKELDAVSAHAKWLEEENSRASQESKKTKTQHSQALLQLREELDQAVVQRDESTFEMRRFATSKQDLENKHEKLSQDFRDSRREAIAASETSDKELQAERKLVDLQKEQLERVIMRHDRLEKELEGLREIAANAAADTDNALDSIRYEIQGEANKVLEEQEGAFKEEIKSLKFELSKREPMGSPLKSRRILTLGDSDEPMGLTDLYARLNQTEDELFVARAECEKQTRIAQNIMAEVSAKTPGILRQRKEYEIALERQEEMHNRLRDAMQETKMYREEASELREEFDRMQRRNEELQGESKDLAKHVQALLASKAGAGVPQGIPTSIAEIQQQNQQLMGEQRRLSTQVDDLQHKLRNDRTTIRMEKAEQELETLQDERTRQETLVASIVQQRDLYRALASNQDETPVDFANTEVVVAQHSKEAHAAVERCEALEQDLAKSRAELTTVKGDKDSLLERVERYNIHTNELTVALQKLQNELSTASANAARSNADAGYHRDKCSRADRNLEDSREEVKRLQDSKKDIQALNSRLHQQLATANAEFAKCENDVRQAEMKLRLAKTQEETSKAAEARLAGEVNQLRTELARQGSLSETIQRIEASLTAKNEEDKEKLKEEVDRLKQLLEQERSKQELETDNLQSRVKDLELTATEAERKKEEAMKDSIAAKEEALGATTEHHNLVAKVARLESELSSANKKLGHTSADPEEVALQTKVESLTQQVEETKTEVATMKERAANFEKVAKASEQELTLLTKASDDFKKAKDSEVESLNKRIEGINEMGKKKDEVIAELTRDLSSQRGEQEKHEAVLKEKIVGMEGQVETAAKNAEAAIARAVELTAEMQRYRDDATKAQNNYDHELEFHATANKDLRVAREEIATEQRLRRTAEEELENAKVEISQKEVQLDGEKEKLTKSMKEMEERLVQTREQNDLLLAQLTALGDQVELAQSDKIEAASGDAVSSDEVETLRKAVSDLREVVKFMRSERGMNDAKIDAARRTAEREKAAAAVTKRSLDEARAEIKILLEQKPSEAGTASTDTEDKLKKAEDQITLLQESNRLLRDEGKKLQKSVASIQAQLADEKTSVAPLEKKHKDLSVENAALVAERKSLQRELESWKNRVQSLVSKFNQIDPEEHSRVVKQVETLQKQCSDVKTQKDSAEKEGANAKAVVSKLNKDLAQQKALVQKQQSLLKKMKTDKDSATVSSSASAAITKDNVVLKEKLQKMESESKSNKTELKGANDRIEMLKQRMRQFQKQLGEQRKKISDLESAAAAPVAEVKAPAMAPVPAPALKPAETAKPAESTQPESKEEKPTEPKEESKSEEATSEKEQPAPAVKETAKEPVQEVLPTAPAGGFKFGPSTTQASKAAAAPSAPSAKKEESQKRAAPAEATPESRATVSTSAPPAKKTKVVDKEPESRAIASTSAPPAKKTKVADKEPEPRATVSTSAPPAKKTKAADKEPESRATAGTGAPPAKKAKVVDKEQDEAPKKDVPEKQEAPTRQGEIKEDETAKAAQALKAKLNQKREALAMRKKKLEEATAKQEAQKRTVAEEQKQETKAAPPASMNPAALAFAPAEAAAEPPVLERSAEPVPETKEAKKPVVEIKKPEVMAFTKTIANAAKVAVQAKAVTRTETEKSAPLAGTTESEAPKAAGFGISPFGGATFGSGTSTFGATSFGKPPTGGGSVFGSASSIGGFGTAPATIKREISSASSATSSVFLDMKPPSSTAAPFTFGSSSITLPKPAIALLAEKPSPFGAFAGSNPFGGGGTPFGGAGAPTSAAQPLFGSSASIKRSVPEEAPTDSKQAGAEEAKETPKEGE